MLVRPETAEDIDVIRAINIAAFADHPHSQQTEHLIVDALREGGALEISLVAELDGAVVGHVAFSRAEVGEEAENWYLLGPVAVAPAHQGAGVGSALVEAGLALLRERGAHGCALVGDPAYYGRFGFSACQGLTCHGVPDEYVLCLPFTGNAPTGELKHHDAFTVSPEAEA